MDLLQILSEEWAIRALIASSLVGVMCGVIGAFMVLRNMSLIGDAISHAILPGIFVAFVFVGYNSMGFFVGTLVAALVSAVAITWIQDHVKTKNDAAIGIIFTFMFSLGVIGISYLNNHQGVHLDLKDFLFGTIMGISDEDIILTAVVTVYALVSVMIFYRYLFITTFQATIAQTMGISVRMMHYFLMLLLSIAVVAALRTVGIILVVAMLITPSATALLITNRLKKVLLLSGIIGLLSAIIGLIAAIILDTPPGPAMCVVATLIYFLAVFFSPSKGLVFKRWRRHKQNIQIEKEDIIKHIFKKKEASEISISAISQALHLSKNKVSNRLNTLLSDGLLSSLTPTPVLSAKGRSKGEALVRAHRLWETFLVDQVGLSDQEIHDDAERHEHLLNQEILDQLDIKLGFPQTDPHGSPIPPKTTSAANPLLRMKPKTRKKISASQINHEIESRLWELGLSPGTLVQLIKIDAEQITIKPSGQPQLEIAASLAKQINMD